MALTGTISFIPTVVQTSQLDLVTGSGVTPTGSAGTAFISIPVTNGTGANQATNYSSDTRTLAAGATETLDFSGGLVDSFGNVLLFTRLILLMVHASPNNVAPVRVDMSLANGIPTFGGSRSVVDVPPGGCILWAATTATAYVVTAGTGDLVRFDNRSALSSCTYDIIAVGS